MTGAIDLLAIFTGLCFVLGVAGWAVEWWIRDDEVLPPPEPRAVAGENYKVWM